MSQQACYPDIEIYLRTDNTECIIDWLSNCFDSVTSARTSGKLIQLIGCLCGQSIPITVIRQAAGEKYTSVTFDSNNTPWTSDLECARAVFRYTGIEVRCSTGSWEEQEELGVKDWWNISEQGECRVSWER